MKKLSDLEYIKFKTIESRLSKTTNGEWLAKNLPYDGFEDPIIVNDEGNYICQTVYDMQSITQEHNIEADTLFIVHAKEDIKFLLDLVEKLSATK